MFKKPDLFCERVFLGAGLFVDVLVSLVKCTFHAWNWLSVYIIIRKSVICNEYAFVSDTIHTCVDKMYE